MCTIAFIAVVQVQLPIHRYVCSTATGVGLTSGKAVADIVHQHCQLYSSMHNSPPPVATVAGLFQTLCYENKDQLSAGIIVAGWDAEEGGQVFNVPLGGGVFRQPWAIGGTCAQAFMFKLIP